LVNLRVTSVIGCPRSYQNTLLGIRKSPSHFANLKGNFIHFCLERLFIWKSVPEFKELRKKFKIKGDSYLSKLLLDELIRLLESVNKWIDETEIDLREEMILGVEKEYRMPIVDDYWLIGHIDLLTKTHIIDFKSSWPAKRISNWQQLGAYRELALYEGYSDYLLGNDWELTNVFLGGTAPVEYGPTLDEVELLMPVYYGRLYQLIEYDRKFREDKSFRMPCEVTRMCAYCDWRGSCRGI